MTIKEIAEEAGVSMMTVSNVINRRYDKVSPPTIEKVKSIIEKYNYVPNLSARSLTAKSSRIIAIIIIASEGDEQFGSLANSYTSSLVGLIERELSKRGYYAMIRSVTTLDDVTIFLRNWNCDGAIFIEPAFDKDIDKLVNSSSIPMAFFDSSSDNSNIINVTIDDRNGGYIATQYLINKGHRRIAFIGNCDNYVISSRFAGYCDALKEHGIEVKPDLVYGCPPTYLMGIATGHELAQHKGDITAVVSAADFSAIGIMEGARQSGLSIPNDLSVIGFDDLSVCLYTTPKLTSISQNLAEKASSAVRMLIDRVENRHSSERLARLGVSIVERESVAPYFAAEQAAAE